MDIQPVADPNAVTSMQKMGKAQLLMELSKDPRGLINPAEAMKRVLEAASVENIEALIPQPDPMQAKQAQMMQAAQEESMVVDLRIKEATLEKIEAETLATIAKAEKDSADVDLLPMKMRIEELKQMKEALRGRREATDAGRTGRMAQPPSDGMAPVGVAPGGGT